MASKATLLDWAYERESSTPDAVWLTQPVGGGAVVDYSWRAALDEARRVASHLRTIGLPPRSQIALLAKNSAHWILADLAIWMAGHVTVPIYPTLNAETVRQILEHSESKLIFVGKLDAWETMKEGIARDLPGIALPLAPKTSYEAWADLISRAKPIDGRVREPDELATIHYTSGSTGQPKGVMLSFGTMCRAAEGILKIFPSRPGDRALSYLPLAHALERVAVESLSLQTGARVFFAESLETFMTDLTRAAPTSFVSVPRLWLKFQQGVLAKMPQKRLDLLLRIPVVRTLVRKKLRAGLGLGSARFTLSGSAPIPSELLEWYRRLGIELLEGYGMTENCAYSHVTRPGEMRVGYVGTPYPEVEARISANGELEVKSPASMMGYFKAPELTAEAFTDDGFLRTGDRGEIDSKGRLRITGRVKELFKTSKGKYVAPVPIENLLLESPIVENVCVTGSGMSQPHAVIMLSDAARSGVGDDAGRARVVAELERHLEEVNRRVDPHEALEFLAVAREPWTIEGGFLTPTLKLRRTFVERTYEPHAAKWYETKERIQWE